MPNLTPFEIILLSLAALLIAVLAAILWWHLAGDRVKALIAGWMALPLFWKIVLPVVFGAFVLHGSGKSDGVGECGSEGEIFSRVERVEHVDRVEGGIVGDSCSGRKEGENSSLQLQLKTTTTLTANDFERGFVLTHIGTNEVFDFSAPTHAVMCDDWLQFGAAEDWVYLESGEHLRVHSDGWLTALAPTSAVFSAK